MAIRAQPSVIGQGSAKVIPGSTIFDDATSDYLTRTPSTEGNRRTNWQETKLNQRRLTAMCRGISKALGVGESWGKRNVKRCRDSYNTASGVVPIFTVMPKDHK